MDWLIAHWTEISKLAGELVAAMAALTTAIIGLCSIIVRIVPALAKDHPALPIIKLLGKLALNKSVRDEDRPTTPHGGTENMRRFIIPLIIALITLAMPAQADEVSIADYSPAFSIGENLKKIPGMKQGIAYSVLDSKINYLTTVEIMQWAIFTIEAGYAGDADATDHKLVGVVSTSLLNMKQLGVTVPILDLIDFRIGLYAGVGGINLGDGPDMRGNNEFDWGASLTAITLKY